MPVNEAVVEKLGVIRLVPLTARRLSLFIYLEIIMKEEKEKFRSEQKDFRNLSMIGAIIVVVILVCVILIGAGEVKSKSDYDNCVSVASEVNYRGRT